MASASQRTISIRLESDISDLPMLVQARILERIDRAKQEIQAYMLYGHKADLLRVSLAAIIGLPAIKVFDTHTTKGPKKALRMGAYKALADAGYSHRTISGVLLMCERTVRNYAKYLAANPDYTDQVYIMAYQRTRAWASQ
jgi:hypothetical protein